jgi:HlyD family secretion protein
LKRLLLLLIPVAILLVWLFTRRQAPPEVGFTKVTRETIESNLKTNGKVEPIEWAAVRAERAGTVLKIDTERGRPVTKGQLLVELDSADARIELSSAQARVSEAKAEIQGLAGGGRPVDLSEIESGINKARADLAVAQREYASLQRLIAKNAATTQELNTARENVDRINMQLQALESRRSSLVSKVDRSAAEARLHEAESTASAAAHRIELGQIRSPMTGIVYQFDLKSGAYLNPGDLVASVGRLNQVRVLVYVDEPELGRVEKGMPVTITWDAMPDRQWAGRVDKVPTQVMPLGTRQVGEVACTIENPDLTLIPGTNVNAEIHSKIVKSALTIPKEALRREGAQTGVLKLNGDRVEWRKVKLGASSITRAQVLEGLSEGDLIALPVDRPLKSGDRVQPVFAQ